MKRVSDQGDEPTDAAVEWLKDLLYTGVGLGVIGINRFQGARRDLQAQLADGTLDGPDLSAFSELLSDPERTDRILAKLRTELQDLDERLGGFEHRLGSILDGIEPDLPEPLLDLSRALRSLADEHADQVRSALGLESR